jgi:hypothetical protein
MTAAAYPGVGQVTTGRNRGTMYGLIGSNQKIPAGAYIAIVGGYWVNVTSTTGLEGRVAKCLKDVDNTGGSAGALPIEVQLLGGREVHLIANDMDGSPVAATDLGDEVYWLDNATITLDDSGTSKAGRAWAFYKVSLGAADETRVWVEVY